MSLIKVSGGIRPLHNDKADGIIANVCNFFLLSASAKDWEAAKQLNFTDEEIREWQGVVSATPYYSSFFYKMKTKDDVWVHGVCRLTASPLFLWIASTKPEDKAMRAKRTKYLMQHERLDSKEAKLKACVSLAKEFPSGYKKAA